MIAQVTVTSLIKEASVGFRLVDMNLYLQTLCHKTMWDVQIIATLRYIFVPSKVMNLCSESIGIDTPLAARCGPQAHLNP